MIQVAPMEVLNFSGGITENIFDGDTSKSAIMDNLMLLPNKTPQTRPGSVVDDTSDANSRIPAGNQRIGALINYDHANQTLLVQSAKKFYYRNPTAYTTIQGPTGNDVFSIGGTSSLMSYSQWNRHIFLTHDGFPQPMKMYKDNLGVMQVRTAGLPNLASVPSVAAGAASTQNFLYAFHYYYTYMVGLETFVSAGPVVFFQLLNSADPSVSPNTISGIPVLANGSTNNYDTVNVQVRIYRTSNGGTTQWLLGHVTNGTTSFTDNLSDAAITNGQILYLADGTLDNDPPPLSKFVHVVNNIGYYASIKTGSEELPTTIRQSSPFTPDACPLGFEDTVEDTITGLSSVQSIPIVLCRRYIYRIEGQFDQFGRGGMSHIRISDNAGCVSNRSIVQAEGGLFWAGNDGFYYSDGYKVQKISDSYNEAYKAMLLASADARNITGKFDEIHRRIIWSAQVNSSSLDNDSWFVLELRYAQTTASGMIAPRPDAMTFTTASGGSSFRPTAVEVYNKKLYRADSRGYVFLHDEQYTTDPLVDTTKFVSQWTTTPIIYHYRSVCFDFGSTYMRKMATKILLTCKNKTNVSIQITAINDDGKIARPLKEIRWRRNFTWGDAEFTWEDPGCFWNSEGLIEQWRRMPAKGLRFSYLQIDITNAFTIITNSDTVGTATVNQTAKTVVLNTSATSAWPVDCVGYFIAFETDQYTRLYEITARTNDTLTILDPQGVVPFGSLKWEIKGTKKGEILNLLSFNIHWANLSKTQSTFESGQDGENNS